MAQDISRQIKELCADSGATLLYACYFGSTLYGTAIEGKSDLDAKGIFLPSLESLILNEAPKSLHFSTGNDNSRNTENDVDIELWSIQYWLLRLLPIGDTGAIDLLFSPSSQSCILYKDPRLDDVFDNSSQFINLSGQGGYAGYSIGQAKKYGIKGSRLGIIKKVYNWVKKNCPTPEKQERLEDYLERLSKDCCDGRYCSIIESNGCPALQICGKINLSKIRMTEFNERITNLFKQYGQRAELAEQNQGLDFKALSHAVRALDQMIELVETGKIKYPLRNKEELIAIKQGKYHWNKLEPLIVEKLAQVDELCAKATNFSDYNLDFAKKIILNCYKNQTMAG